jgi:DNA-binding transcriptional regulator YiaG
MTEFQEYLKRHSDRLGVGRTGLAKLLGVSRDCIDKWQNGQRRPTALTREIVHIKLKNAKPLKK